MSALVWDFSNAPTLASVNSSIKSLSGWDGKLTSEFGNRILEGESEFHRGIDIAMPRGTRLQSNISGEVIASGEASNFGYDASYGNLVVIKDSAGIEHFYAHLDYASVKVGEKIVPGEYIGKIGSTGHSTGSHLHYEINIDGVPIDPTTFVERARNFNPNFNTREELAQIPGNHEQYREGVLGFVDFINAVREHGLSIALFDKPFDQLIVDSLTDIARAIGIFITKNGDLFFLMPALVFIFGTYMVGKNRFTKWIIPLLIAYVCSVGYYHLLV